MVASSKKPSAVTVPARSPAAGPATAHAGRRRRGPRARRRYAATGERSPCGSCRRKRARDCVRRYPERTEDAVPRDRARPPQGELPACRGGPSSPCRCGPVPASSPPHFVAQGELLPDEHDAQGEQAQEAARGRATGRCATEGESARSGRSTSSSTSRANRPSARYGTGPSSRLAPSVRKSVAASPLLGDGAGASAANWGNFARYERRDGRGIARGSGTTEAHRFAAVLDLVVRRGGLTRHHRTGLVGGGARRRRGPPQVANRQREGCKADAGALHGTVTSSGAGR